MKEKEEGLTTLLSFRITEEQLNKLREEAKKIGISVSALLRYKAFM